MNNQKTLIPQRPMLIAEMAEDFEYTLDSLTGNQLKLMFYLAMDPDNRWPMKTMGGAGNSTARISAAKEMMEQYQLEEWELIKQTDSNYWMLTERGLLAISYWMTMLHDWTQEALNNLN